MIARVKGYSTADQTAQENSRLQTLMDRTPPVACLGFRSPPAVLGGLSKTCSPLGRGVDGSVSSFFLCIRQQKLTAVAGTVRAFLHRYFVQPVWCA